MDMDINIYRHTPDWIHQ